MSNFHEPLTQLIQFDILFEAIIRPYCCQNAIQYLIGKPRWHYEVTYCFTIICHNINIYIGWVFSL